MNIEELQLLVKELGQPAYRAVQVFEWLHRRFPNSGEAFSFAGMNNLPKALRDKLESRCYITPVNVEKTLYAQDGTIKFLLAVGGGESAPACVYIESVLMEYAHGHSLCISTQAGCRMGCIFCATGHSGLLRNLSAGEMCRQVYAARTDAVTHGSLPSIAGQNGDIEMGRIRNIVLMGCGEPLDNYDATLRFIELITHPKGYGLSQRHITLSTCGLIPEIRELAKKKLQINLAISLHGPDDATRQALMPVAAANPIKELLAACREYANITRRRITFEYALTQGINDNPIQARTLANLLKGMLCHVNLIPVNPTGLTTLSPATKSAANAFAAVLQDSNIPATIRRTIGAEVDAACGQLRAAHTNSLR